MHDAHDVADLPHDPRGAPPRRTRRSGGRRFPWCGAAVAAGGVLLGAAGCSSMKVEMTHKLILPPQSPPGNRIGDATIAQIKDGSSTRAWLVAVLGEPTSSSRVGDEPNTEVLRYVTAEPAGGVMGLLTGSAGRGVSTTYFVVVDGVVTRHWNDRAEEPQLIGSEKKTGGAKQGG